jgi:hypothetical protein
MKKIVLSLLFLLVASAFAENKNAIGLWIQTGPEHWGLDWKHKISGRDANDLYLSFDFGRNSWSFGIYDGYYFHYNVFPIDRSEIGSLPLYWGPRGGVGLWGGDNWTDAAIHIGLVGGIAFDLAVIPLGFYLEINPTFEMRFEGDDSWLDFGPYVRFGLRGWLF